MSRATQSRFTKWLWRVLGFFIGTVSPRELTTTRMGVLQVRIREYWKANGKLPPGLSDLPLLENRDNATTDGWGRPISYTFTEPSTVTLRSSGEPKTEPREVSPTEITLTFNASQDR